MESSRNKPVIFRGKALSNYTEAINLGMSSDNESNVITFVFDRKYNTIDLNGWECQLMLNATFLPSPYEVIVTESTGLTRSTTAGTVTISWLVSSGVTYTNGTGTGQFKFISSDGGVWQSNVFNLEVTESITASSSIIENNPDILTDHTERLLALETNKLDIENYETDKTALEASIATANINASNAVATANGIYATASTALTNSAAALTESGLALNYAGEAYNQVSNKVDKKTTTGTFAYTHNGATQSEIIISQANTADTPNSIVQRTNRQVKGIAPAANDDYTIMSYVDAQDIATLITAGEYADGVAATAESNANSYTDTAVAGYVPLTQKGAANGVCPLGSDSKVSSTYLPSYVDDIIEVANYAALPTTGETGKIYVTLDTNLTYRWSGTAYVEISQSLALGETSSTAYRGDRGKTAYDNSLTLVSQMAAVLPKLAKIDTGSITTNPNNININGFYTCYQNGVSGTVNAPFDDASSFILHQNSNSSNLYSCQIAVPYDGSGRIKYRVEVNEVFTAWDLIITGKTENFPWEVGTVSANAFTYDCSLRKNYKLTNTQDIVLTVANAVNGFTGAIRVYGGYALTLPANFVLSADFSYLSALGNQNYLYTFDYDGTNYYWSRTVEGVE